MAVKACPLTSDEKHGEQLMTHQINPKSGADTTPPPLPESVKRLIEALAQLAAQRAERLDTDRKQA